MNPRNLRPLAIVGAGLAIVLGALLFRPTRPPAAPPSAPPVAPAPALPSAPPPPPAPPPSTSSDPLLRQWQGAIRARDAKGVLNAQSAFLSREEEYREPLMTMAKDDADPRIRAFSVAVLGRMKARPPESFFVERLDDASEHPRVSSLQALEKFGTAACLPKVERLASADGADAVRSAAAQTAKAVRQR